MCFPLCPHSNSIRILGTPYCPLNIAYVVSLQGILFSHPPPDQLLCISLQISSSSWNFPAIIFCVFLSFHTLIRVFNAQAWSYMCTCLVRWYLDTLSSVTFFLLQFSSSLCSPHYPAWESSIHGSCDRIIIVKRNRERKIPCTELDS